MKRKSDNRVRHTAWIVFAVSLMLAGWTMAQPPAPGPGGPGGPGKGRPAGPGLLQVVLRDADTDGNQQISLEEFKAGLTKHAEDLFKRLDRNGDGSLTPEDRPAGGPEGPMGRPMGPGGPLMEKIREADKDGDGKVTFEEISASMPQVTQEQFKQFDRNGDGVLSAQDRGPGPMRELFDKADADKSGTVTFEELKAAKPDVTQEQFKQWDRNGDGTLSPDDRPAGPGPGPAPGTPAAPAPNK